MKSRLQINVSDPWEFYEDNDNSGIFFATLIDCQDDGILFYSDIPITLRSKTQKKQWNNFFGVSRYTEKISTKIHEKDGCLCNIIAIASNIVTISDAIHEKQKWRGGNAILAQCLVVMSY